MARLKVSHFSTRAILYTLLRGSILGELEAASYVHSLHIYQWRPACFLLLGKDQRALQLRD